ncbi:LacI family transcriptional regulator [Herbiconiux sp. CPCC 203407]|uniref:LacI family transcriptional regulator n=1 Tax=Herbiconiux oxytropis TaxID=2970915 RepID=A0AA41XKG4_9MICO|nr:LacI family DNA-binding transcriptional regulator [Herbiconiux oxytropis]MCS5723951.1 LacI family transcriptional regulator [Herbiconiux oxytropis]MCS5728043.1 LacI family transcriptional regulator [Herbiconiux oxytropis]
MDQAPHRVTIREVAAHAGLSISTVSRALTGSRAVLPELVRRAQDSASELGYRADTVGRSLRTQRTGTFGLVVPDLTNPFFPALVQALEHAARSRGLSILIADTGNDPEVETAAMNTLLDRRVDALLVSPVDLEASREGLISAATTVPVLQIDRVIDEGIPFVRVDQEAPVKALVERMIATGRRHLAFIGQDPRIATSREREVAFAQAMSERFAGGPLRSVTGGTSPQSGRAAAETLLSRWPETDGVVCANDLIAVGVLEHVRARLAGRRIAVSGFDDTLMAQVLELTSVRQPVQQLADLAIAAAAHPDRSTLLATRAVVASEVVFRRSTD